MEGSGGNAPLVTSDFFLRHWFYRPAAGALPFEIGSGSGSHTHLKKFIRLLSVHWSSFPRLKLVESVGNAPTSTCLQGRCIACLPRPQEKLASRPGAAPGELSFGDSAAQVGARLVEIKRAGSVHAPGPCHFNKEQTPPGDLFDPSPRFHGGCFGV